MNLGKQHMNFKECDAGGYWVYLTWLFRSSLDFHKRSGQINVSPPPDFCQEQLRKQVCKKAAEQTRGVRSCAGCCGLLPLWARSSVAVDAENGQLFFFQPGLGNRNQAVTKIACLFSLCFR